MSSNIAMIFNCLVRVSRCAQAVQAIREDIADPDRPVTTESVQRVALNVLTCVAEVGSLASQVGNARPEMQLRWNAAAAAADLGHVVHRLHWKGDLNQGDYLDLLGVIAFRVSLVAGNAAVLSRPLFGFDRNQLQRVEDISSAIAIAIQNRHALPQGWIAIQSIFEYFRRRQIQPEMTLIVNHRFIPAMEIDAEYMRMIHPISQAESIEEFQTIPALFENDAVLRRFRCPISRNPIRFVQMVESPSGITVYYETANIMRLLEEQPEQPPRLWPDDVPFLRENIQDCPSAQAQINQYLNTLLQAFKALSMTELDANEFSRLARAIGITDPAVSNKQISRAIRVNFSSPQRAAQIAALSVSTVEHAFDTGARPKMTRVIELQTRSHQPGLAIAVDNARAFLRGMFGSMHAGDQAAMNEFIAKRAKFRLYLSMDLQNTQTVIE